MKRRDNQRSRVYAWERHVVGASFYSGGDFKRAEDAEAWLAPIWRKERGRLGLASTGAPKVERPSWGQRAALAHHSEWKITLPVWARSKWIVLHEAAHMLTPRDESHGPRFVGVLIGLACRWLDYDADQLMAIADEHGVKYHVRSIGVVPVHGTAWMLRKVLSAHEPMTAMDLASWISIGEGFEVTAKQVRAAAMQLIRAGEARWLRRKLVPVAKVLDCSAANVRESNCRD